VVLAGVAITAAALLLAEFSVRSEMVESSFCNINCLGMSGSFGNTLLLLLLSLIVSNKLSICCCCCAATKAAAAFNACLLLSTASFISLNRASLNSLVFKSLVVFIITIIKT
jgi:hypothetical protein